MCSQLSVSVSFMKSFFFLPKIMKTWGLQLTCQHFIVKYREIIFGNSPHDKVTQKPTLCFG